MHSLRPVPRLHTLLRRWGLSAPGAAAMITMHREQRVPLAEHLQGVFDAAPFRNVHTREVIGAAFRWRHTLPKIHVVEMPDSTHAICIHRKED